MLSGHVPFTAETAVGILMKHLTEPLPLPPKGVALPPAVNGVLRKAMARDARERFSTAGELAESLTRAADTRATVTLHASGIRRVVLPILKLPLWVRRLRAKKTRLSLAALTFAAAFAFGYAFWPSSPPMPLPKDSAALAPETVHPVEPSESASPLPDASGSSPETAKGRDASPAGAEKNLATLEIGSAKAAQVFLDGTPLGMAPGTFMELAPGEHVVLLDAGDGKRAEQTLVMTAGSTHRIHFDFAEPVAEASRASRPLTDLPSKSGEKVDVEPPEVRRWSGFLTDDDCGATGGEQGALHLRCAERCIREGRKPRFYARGKLYRLEGFERIEVFRDQPLRFRAWLEGDTLHVVTPGADALRSDSKD
jgi:hypothetical protein